VLAREQAKVRLLFLDRQRVAEDSACIVWIVCLERVVARAREEMIVVEHRGANTRRLQR